MPAEEHSLPCCRKLRCVTHDDRTQMNILVTGGTGTLGRNVVKQLLDSGHRVRILSRRPGTGHDWIQGDLATGAGLEAAVTGIDVIVHAASATVEPQKVHGTDVLG